MQLIHIQEVRVITNQQSKETNLLTPLSQYIRSGRSPINLRWAIQVHGSQMEDFGAIIRYGNRWLVSENELFDWLRHQARENHD